MTDNATVVDTTVVPAETSVVEIPVVNPSIAALDTQKADFKSQLEKAKTDMTNLQKQFESIKTHAVKLEGAIESLDILRASLTK